MPPKTFAILIGGVIVAAGASISLAVWAGLPLVTLGLVALAASLLLRVRR